LIIFATGISGSGRLEYLRQVEELSGGKLEIVDIGSLMFEKSEQLGISIPQGKILDLDHFALSYLRAVTFEEVLRKVDKYRGASEKDLVISTHTCFRWKKHLVPAFNFYYLNRIDPDLYITIIDNAHYVWARLQRSHWRGRLSLKDILVWRDEETFITSMLAEYQRKPFYLICRGESPSLLWNIIDQVERPALKGEEKKALKAYLSYPMTYVRNDRELMRTKDEIKERLREAGIIVFDPIATEEADIIGLAADARSRGQEYVEFELEGSSFKLPVSEVEAAKDDIIDQIVARDYRLIDQSNIIIVYYPVTTLSAGVLSEINYGFTHNKDVYAIFPQEEKSPFFTYYTTKVFRDVDQLLEHLKATGRI